MAEPWPASLPQLPIGDSVSYVARDNVIRSQMEAGTAKLRRRYTAVGDDVALALMCTREQAEALQAFYETTLVTVRPFTWKHFRKAGWPDADYRFKSPPRFVPAGGIHWRAELELERLPATYGSGPIVEPSAATASSAPENATEPTISGSTAPGSILTATAGAWTGVPTPVVVGQWQRKVESVWSNIAGATSLNFATVDLGSHRYKETATNTAGIGTTSSSPIVIADQVQTPADAPPLNTALPVVTGSGLVGGALLSSSGEWTGYPVPTYAYQWQSWDGAGWANIAGATANTYTPTAADDYRCAVTATNTVTSVTAYSEAVPVIAEQTAPANSVAPEVTGDTAVGATLTSTTGTWSGEPAPTFAYQWQRYTAGAFANIAGATGSTYVTADEGSHRCAVTATNVVNSVIAYSNAINIGTTQIAPTVSTAPIISGNARSGSTISALPGVWDGSEPITFAYQWQVLNSATWEDIVGATGTGYTTPAAGSYRCEVTAGNTGGVLSAYSNTMTVAEAPAGSPPVSKTFTGAASDNLDVTAHDSTLSYFDNPNVATELLVIKLATNSVHGGNTAGSLQAVYPNTRTFGARQRVEVTVYNTDTTSQVAMVLRFADYNNCIICYLGGAGSTLVQKIAGTAYNHALGNTVVAGDVISCEINEAGTVCEVRVNGAHTTGGTWPSPITLSGGAQPAGNLAGAGLWGTTNSELSSFTAFTVDDFSGSSEKPVLDYAPQIIGTPTIGETITSTRGVWFAAPEPTYAYLWQVWDGVSAWVAAAGTNTVADYVPASGGDYRCRVNASNSAGLTTAYSASITVAGGTVGTGTYTQARVLFDETHGGAEPMIATLQFRATVGGAALTGPAFASSEAGAFTAASQAFDADPVTYWEPSLDLDDVTHIGQTFASGQALAEFAMTYPNVEAGYTAAAPRTFRLQGWDGAQWITLKTVTNDPAWAPGETRTYPV